MSTRWKGHFARVKKFQDISLNQDANENRGDLNLLSWLIWSPGNSGRISENIEAGALGDVGRPLRQICPSNLVLGFVANQLLLTQILAAVKLPKFD